MDKIMILLEVPILDETFEMQVSVYLQIGPLLSLIVKVVEIMSDGIYQASGQEFLCSYRYGEVLKDMKSLLDYKIQNGEHLLLI